MDLDRPAPPPPAPPCDHAAIDVATKVAWLVDTQILMLETSLSCQDCGMRFQPIGVGLGVSTSRPAFHGVSEEGAPLLGTPWVRADDPRLRVTTPRPPKPSLILPTGDGKN